MSRWGTKRRDEVTPGEQEILEENRRVAGEALGALVDARRLHLSTGCKDWWCSSMAEIDLLDAFEPHQLRQVLASAIHQLAQQETT